MEQLLGIGSMCQYDAIAPVIDVFGGAPDNAAPYNAILPARSIIAEVNAKTAYRARDSAKFDFTHADQAPEEALNDIIWHSVKGAGVPAPNVSGEFASLKH